ncbi:MAG: DUF11 domain-containing protein [Ardenticatenales bacterium]|nr:DUF11 domain-containing protein [Ardenticatenales bacterium]
MSRPRIRPVFALLLFACLLPALRAQTPPIADAQTEGCPPAVVVTSRADSGPRTLRHALATVCDGGVITFGFALPATIRLTTGHLVADRSVTIDATGSPGVTVSGSNAVRVLRVMDNATVMLNNLTIRNGLAAIGGGILNAGTLTLNHVTLTASAARAATGTSRGGGIMNLHGTLILNDSRVQNSIAAKIHTDPEDIGGLGGGIFNEAGSVILNQSVIADNIAELGSGGGVYNNGGQVQADGATFSGNKAGYSGGGLFNSGAAAIAGSTFSGNVALMEGGGISHAGGLLDLRNSTISGNQGNPAANGDRGAGVYAYAGILTLNNTTITRNTNVNAGAGIYNTTATVTFTNSIIAGNIADFDCAGPLETGGHNLVSGIFCPLDEASDLFIDSDLVFTEVLSATLNDNGGGTQTHALLPYSPAINTADDATCAADDQRGVPRPQSFACDMGAYEADSDADLILGYAPHARYVPPDQPLVYTLVITNAGPLDAHNVVLTDTLSADVTFLSADADLGACGQAGVIVTCTLPLLPAFSTTNVDIIVMPPDGPRAVTNRAIVLADTVDAYLPDNNAGSENQVCHCTDLALAQTVTPTAPLHGDIITFTVTAVNSTTAEIATRIFLTDTFPSSAVLITFTTTTGECEFLGNRVACALGTLLPGESADVVVAVFANETTELENLAQIDSYEFDYTPDDNSIARSVDVVPVSDLGVTKKVNPGLAILNEPLTYTLVLSNDGPDVGRPIRMVAVLPDSFTYVPPFTKQARLHFHLDDPPGSTQFHDSSTYGSDMTCNAGNCPQAGIGGRFGAGLQFDGSNDYLSGPTGNGMNPGAAFTLAAWMYAPNASQEKMIGGKSDNTNSGYLLGYKSGDLYARVWDTSGQLFSLQGGSIASNTWVHLAMTWQTNGQFTIYVNGLPVGSMPAGPFMVGSNSVPFEWGRAPWGQYYFNGKLDEGLYFRRALSAGEVRDLYLGVYAAACDALNSATISCVLAALAPQESVYTNITVVPTQEGWFNYRADAAQPTHDPNLQNNTTFLRTRVVTSTAITLTMEVRYSMQDGSFGHGLVWLLNDGTFVDNDAGTGTWQSLTQPKRLTLTYDPGYSCNALMTGEVFPEFVPHVQGVRQCQDGTGLTGIWRGDFILPDEGSSPLLTLDYTNFSSVLFQ